MKSFLAKSKHFLTKMQDILLTDMIYLFPCVLKWFYHLKIKRDIFDFRFSDDQGKEAILYQHGKLNFEKETQVSLILHGHYSHPLVMLHIAEMMRKTTKGPVFSFYVSYDELNPKTHRRLLAQAIDHIEKLLKEKDSSLKGIVMVGHSMGAVESAYQAFVKKDPRITSVISIAGRLKVVESLLSPCDDSFKPTVDKVFNGIQALPNVPLFQIIGSKDWNAPLEAMLIREHKGYYCIVDKAMHFNILFHKEMHTKLPEFLRASLAEPRKVV